MSPIGQAGSPEPRGPLASPGYHLLQAAQAWRRELGARLRPLQLTPTQFDVIASLSWVGLEHPDPTQQQVADFAGMDRMMLSKLASGLEERGLLFRILDPVDARLRRLRLTPRGRALVDRATAIARAVDSDLFVDARLREPLKDVVARATR